MYKGDGAEEVREEGEGEDKFVLDLMCCPLMRASEGQQRTAFTVITCFVEPLSARHRCGDARPRLLASLSRATNLPNDKEEVGRHDYSKHLEKKTCRNFKIMMKPRQILNIQGAHAPDRGIIVKGLLQTAHKAQVTCSAARSEVVKSRSRNS